MARLDENGVHKLWGYVKQRTPVVTQSIGGSEAAVMSQAAVTTTFAQKAYLISVFEELKIALLDSNIDAAIAVLDEAILDLSTLS